MARRTVGRTSGNVSSASSKGSHTRGTRKGVIRAPSAKTGTGFSSGRARKGTIRTTNRYS